MSVVHDGNRQQLLSNPCVASVSSRQIRYTKEFMHHALSGFAEGIPAPSIWSDCGFDLSDFKPNYFRKCIRRWQSQLIDGEFVHQKRGRQRSELLNKDEEIAYLRAENAILKEFRALGITGEIKDSGLSPELYRQIVASHAPDSVSWQELARQAITCGWQGRKKD